MSSEVLGERTMLANLDTLIGFAAVMLILSLVITLLVQIVQTILDLRGRNLLWGVEQIIKDLNIDVGDGDARGFAQKILTHPSVCGGVGRATAIRSSELRLLLERVSPAGSGEWAGGRISALRDRVLDWLMKVSDVARDPAAADRLVEPTAESVEQLTQATAAAIAALSPGKDAATLATEIREELDKPMRVAQLGATKFKEHFDLVMDRTTDRFIHYTRRISLVVALGVALFFHVDAVRIHRQISSDAELRASLVAASGALLATAERVQSDVLDVPLASRAIEAMPIWLDSVRALSDTLSAEPTPAPQPEPGAGPETVAEAPEAAADEAPDSLRTELVRLAAELDTVQVIAALPRLEDPPPGMIRRAEGRGWVRGQLEDQMVASSLELYDFAFARVASGHLQTLLGESDSLLASVDSRLRLFDNDHTLLDYGIDTRGSRNPFRWGWALNRHFVGVLLSALLLSLGAPFWFNALKSLTALRPVLAGKVDTDEKAGSGPGTGVTP